MKKISTARVLPDWNDSTDITWKEVAKELLIA